MRLPVGYHYVHLPETGSTIDEAMERALSGGDWVVIADRQTAGRGQYGRAFSSEPGGLYLGMSWRPNAADVEKTPELTAVAGRAVRDAVEALTGVRPDIKPPNDLLIRGRKICGILTEARAGAEFVMVFGIGVNISNRFPPELQGIAGSLLELTGTAPEPEALAEEIITRLYEALL